MEGVDCTLAIASLPAVVPELGHGQCMAVNSSHLQKGWGQAHVDILGMLTIVSSRSRCPRGATKHEAIDQ
jgi:hypothetical protein